MLIGSLLAGGYMFRALALMLADADEPLVLCSPVPRNRELVVLALALCSMLLGLMPLRPLGLLQIGRPHASEVGTP